MRVFCSDRFEIPLPDGHRFPMRKYTLLRERVEASRDPRLRFEQAPRATDAVLTTAHEPSYIVKVCAGRMSPAEVRQLGFPWSAALVERSRRSVGATVAALEVALSEGVAVSLAGGTHHAHRAAGGGFCLFNDIAAAALTTFQSGRAERILVVDCDVHQGDGTARILAAHDSLYTFSIHSARNYPNRKASSDCDIALPDGVEDEQYLEHLRLGLDRSFASAEPQAIVYVAGADPYAHDRLGRLELTKAGLAERDATVFEYAERANAAIAVVMGGGYADAIDDIVDIHYGTVTAAVNAWSRRNPATVQKAFS